MTEINDSAPRRVLVADDEVGIRLILKKRIEATDGFDVVGEAATGEEVMKLFQLTHPHVVFLDVDMPLLSGIDCARQIQDLDPSCVIIFATGHEEYREEAFEVYAFDYLVKPFKLERLDQTLQRILSRPGENAQAVSETLRPAKPLGASGRLMLRHKDGVTFMNTNEILLVQREERSTVLYTERDGRFVLSETLGEIEERLDPRLFFRCHKSYIINLEKIRNITPYGRWTYVVQLDGTKHDALITHEKFGELEEKYK